MKESDLYPPLKTFLEAQHYEVKGEVNNCDVMAVRGDEEPVVVELKLILNLDLILQAVDRLWLTSKVYIGVPTKCQALKKRRKQVTKLARMLGIGLIAINPDLKTGNVDVIVDPGEYKPRKSKRRRGRLLREFHKRIGDPNPGGINSRKGIMTAYRQRALAIAHYLEQHGATKASVIAKTLEDPQARNILYKDAYGWFDRLGNGVYELSPRGRQELPQWTMNGKKQE